MLIPTREVLRLTALGYLAAALAGAIVVLTDLALPGPSFLESPVEPTVYWGTALIPLVLPGIAMLINGIVALTLCMKRLLQGEDAPTHDAADVLRWLFLLLAILSAAAFVGVAVGILLGSGEPWSSMPSFSTWLAFLGSGAATVLFFLMYGASR